jgi:ABC-2 type transport system permease protein
VSALVAAHGARGLFRSKSVLGALLVGLFAVALAIATRFAGGFGTRRFEEYALILLATVATPLISLFLGAWAMGAEREGQTLVFVFTRPIRRSAVLAGRAAAALGVAIGTIVVTAALCALALDGLAASTGGILVALALETLALTSVFVLMGTLLPRALYVGLAYAVLVEGVMGGFVQLSGGLTITQHARNLVERWSVTKPIEDFRLDQDVGTSIVVLILASLACLAIAAWWIETREVGGRERVKGES